MATKRERRPPPAPAPAPAAQACLDRTTSKVSCTPCTTHLRW
jgi:hypothetical protein